jgi:hypothetical protein
MMKLQAFIDRHRPDAGLRKASAEQLKRYREHLPASLLELWAQQGFGFYGDGLIQLIDPDVYRQNLWGWLMRDWEDMERLPIAMNCRGRLFYYRRLDDGDDEDAVAEDLSWLDPHDSSTGCTVWSLDEFFNSWCVDAEVLDEHFEADRLAELRAQAGRLATDEMYTYAPALRLGGSGATATVQRVQAPVQLDLLLQLALQD